MIRINKERNENGGAYSFQWVQESVKCLIYMLLYIFHQRENLSIHNLHHASPVKNINMAMYEKDVVNIWKKTMYMRLPKKF